MATFLDVSLSPDQLDKLTDHLRFENFQKNDSVNNEGGKASGAMNEDGRFIRNGNNHTIQFSKIMFKYVIQR